MKITLETTESIPRRVVTMEISSDDLNVWEAMDQVVTPALVGFGYAAESVADLGKRDQ